MVRRWHYLLCLTIVRLPDIAGPIRAELIRWLACQMTARAERADAIDRNIYSPSSVRSNAMPRTPR
jgi:hypothetical protein